MTHSSRLLSIASLVVAGALVSTSAVAVRGAQAGTTQASPEADRAHRRPAEPSAGHARIPGRQPAVPEGAVGVPGVNVQVYFNGWPTKTVDGQVVDDNAALDKADAVLIYADGGKSNPAIQGDRIKVIDALAARGVGLGFAHYAVEVPVGRARRGDVPLDWRLLRGSLLGQPDVEAAVRQVPGAPGDARGEAVLDPRRVVLQHALDGRCGGEEPDHAAARRHAE